MINKDLQNSSDNEILSVGDEKIQRMIKNLHRVDAPKDFDFRLKARIANAKPTEFQPRYFPVLRYVLPLSVVVLVFTFVIVSGVYFTGNNEQLAKVAPAPPVESKFAPPDNFQPVLPETAQIPAESAPNMILAESPQPIIQTKKKEKTIIEETNFVAVRNQKKPLTKMSAVKPVDEGGGSYDSTVSVPPIVRTPVGTFSKDVSEIAPNNENKNDIITKQILLPLGIEIVSENGNRRVVEVKKGSIAERSKVKVGDLIEAIDGEKVSGDAVRTKTLEGKKIMVLRGSDKFEISLNK